jgi:hypothetical protein
MSTQSHIDVKSMSADDQRFEYVSPSGTEVKLENPVTVDLFEAAHQAFFGTKNVTVAPSWPPTPRLKQ